MSYLQYLNHEVVFRRYRVYFQFGVLLRNDGHTAVDGGGGERPDLDWGASRPEVNREGEVGEAVLEAGYGRWDRSGGRHPHALIDNRALRSVEQFLALIVSTLALLTLWFTPRKGENAKSKLLRC